ncbi:zinc finger protein 93 [Zeugodacus cucurbitae]|uniref:zinc finger protein 93 n=1 Tax=Zeugodacus cucurbitae TaxID=28588 RepID=UPI0005969A8E|nr:zinc finger protein 93 [Zeugodacus cucurbitae]
MEQVAHVEACRLCANFYVTGAEVEFVHLYQPLDGLEEQLQFVRTELGNWRLQISDNDGLPQRICANCFTQFCNIYAFRQQCMLAQEKLLQSFVGVGLSANNTATDVSKPQVSANADLSSDSELLNGLKIEAPVTSAELMASLDCLQTPTTSADVIASLDGMQMPASVAETLSMLTQELTTMQNGTLLDTSANSITTHANMDTKTAQTNVLQFNAATTTTQNIYYTQQTPISTVSAGTNTPVTLVASSSSSDTKRAAKCGKSNDIDLEDMLQGSIIQKSTNTTTDLKPTTQSDVAAAQEHYASYDELLEDDMDLISCSEPEDSQEMDELEADVDPSTQTRISRNPFACQYCYCPNSGSIDHLVFDSSEALSQHFFDVHDPNLPYTCPYCPQKYSSVKQRDYHVRLIHPTAAKAEHCSYCKKSLRSPKELHEFNCQYVSNWHCETCDQRFVQVPLGRFRTHQRHHAASKYKCRDCARVFVRRSNLEAHERMHRPAANPVTHTIQCEQCKEVYSNDYELRRHKYQAHNGALPVRCEYCHKGFVSMAFLSRHTQHFHPEKLNSNNYASATCSNCGCAFSSIHKLRLHLQRPRDENGRCVEIVHEVAPYQERARQLRRPRLHSCQHCNKRFSTRATLEKHMSTHEAVTYGCNECTTTFENANELKQHVMQLHVKPRYLKCEHCDKRFCYMRELQQHQRVHAAAYDDKSLHCAIYRCGFVASSAQEAHDHAVLKHKLLACDYCDGLFSRNRLSAHVRNAHASVIGATEPNNNRVNEGRLRANATLAAQNEDSLAVASILNHTSSQVNNNDIMVSFEDNANNGGEKVRVELVHQQTPSISSLVLQEQTSNTFKPLIPSSAVDEMEQNFLMNNLLDPDHEIIVT